MDLGGRDPKQIIMEQRDQLMALRKSMKDMEGRSKGLSFEEVDKLVKEFHRVPEGKMIGLKVPDNRRERLVAQQERFKAKTYRQLVQTCVELGLRVLEGVEDARGAVEEVQSIQRSDDQGNGSLRTATAAVG